MKFLGNQVLKTCKKINEKEKELKTESYEKRLLQAELQNIIYELTNFMVKSANQNVEKINQNVSSKTAKRDLAKKLENKSAIDWER